MTQTSNLTWGQGEDLTVELIYKEGPDEGTLVVIDLSAGYSVRMDIVVPATKERLYTFNSDVIADVDPIDPATTPDNTLEGTMSSGVGGAPNISITVPRSLTLPGGSVYEKLSLATPITVFNYDIFLRNVNTDKQVKILKGSITIEDSYTLWP